MLYKRKFRFHNFLLINLETNNNIIFNKVSNHLGEIKGKAISNRNIDFRIIFEPVRKLDNKNKLWRQEFIENKAPEVVITDLPSVRVIADPYLETVRAYIRHFRTLKESLVEYAIFQPLRFILAKSKIFFIHASFVSGNEKNIILSGPQDCGKSTLAISLVMKRGFKLLADDKCFFRLTNKSVEVFPVPTSIGVKKKTLDEFPELSDKVIPRFKFGGKKRLFLDVICENARKRYYCDFLIFPRYKERSKTALRKLPFLSALKKLAQAHLTRSRDDKDNKLFIKYFWALYSLVAKVSCFELIYNDQGLDRACDLVEEIVYAK